VSSSPRTRAEGKAALSWLSAEFSSPCAAAFAEALRARGRGAWEASPSPTPLPALRTDTSTPLAWGRRGRYHQDVAPSSYHGCIFGRPRPGRRRGL